MTTKLKKTINLLNKFLKLSNEIRLQAFVFDQSLPPRVGVLILLKHVEASGRSDLGEQLLNSELELIHKVNLSTLHSLLLLVFQVVYSSASSRSPVIVMVIVFFWSLVIKNILDLWDKNYTKSKTINFEMSMLHL